MFRIAFDADGAAWIGSEGGVSRFSITRAGGTCATATRIRPGTDLSARILGVDDTDYFAFTVFRPFSRIEVTASDPDGRLDLSVFRSCDSIGRARHIGGEQRLVFDVISQTGTYYIEVAPNTADSNAYPLPYRLHLGLAELDPGVHKRTLILTHRADEVLTAEADPSGVLAYAVACHSGLNAPGDHPEPLDFPEAWSQRGGTFIGSTGWAYGLHQVLGYQEELMADFTQELVDGSGSAVGYALLAAKHRYHRTHDPNHFHAKTLAGTTLYGLPMYHVRVQGSASSNTPEAGEEPPGPVLPDHEVGGRGRQRDDRRQPGPLLRCGRLVQADRSDLPAFGLERVADLGGAGRKAVAPEPRSRRVVRLYFRSWHRSVC